MGFLKQPQVNLQPPAPQPVPPLAVTTDRRPSKKPMTPTFLGTEATPGMGGGIMGTPSASGGKTLLGQ